MTRPFKRIAIPMEKILEGERKQREWNEKRRVVKKRLAELRNPGEDELDTVIRILDESQKRKERKEREEKR